MLSRIANTLASPLNPVGSVCSLTTRFANPCRVAPRRTMSMSTSPSKLASSPSPLHRRIAAGSPRCPASPFSSFGVGGDFARLRRGFVSSSSLLLSSPPFDSGSGSGSGDTDELAEGDPKLAIIRRWMKWNQSKTWRYAPDDTAIDAIGKMGPIPLDAFRDVVPREKRVAEPVGRSWTSKELRRKSYEDLHKLWYVLYKERNMLLTESNLSRRHSFYMNQSDRRKKVRKSMGAIKQVLGERKRAKIAEHKLYVAELKVFTQKANKGNVGDDTELKSLMMQGDSSGDEMEDAMDRESEDMEITEEKFGKDGLK